jgi:hypothetical protein
MEIKTLLELFDDIIEQAEQVKADLEELRDSIDEIIAS